MAQLQPKVVFSLGGGVVLLNPIGIKQWWSESQPSDWKPAQTRGLNMLYSSLKNLMENVTSVSQE